MSEQVQSYVFIYIYIFSAFCYIQHLTICASRLSFSTGDLRNLRVPLVPAKGAADGQKKNKISATTAMLHTYTCIKIGVFPGITKYRKLMLLFIRNRINPCVTE